MLVNVIGDVMMSAGVVAYLGAFTVSPCHDVEEINVCTKKTCMSSHHVHIAVSLVCIISASYTSTLYYVCVLNT